MTKIESADVKRLLERKHNQDVFVTECKTGSAGSQILDAWTMKRSWAKQVYTGYEVKVSRGDFLGDDKWTNYLPFCDRFYFVCPHGLIDKGEIGDKSGLMYVSKTGKILRVVKKAPPIEHDVESVRILMSYILMYRIEICDSTYAKNIEGREGNLEFWEQWLRDKEYSSSIGRSVSKELRARFELEVRGVKEENERLLFRMRKYDDIRKFLKERGIDLPYYGHVRAVDNHLFGEAKSLLNSLKNANRYIETLSSNLEKRISGP